MTNTTLARTLFLFRQAHQARALEDPDQYGDPTPDCTCHTRQTEGRPSAGPVSFFKVLTYDAAIVVIGVENWGDMRARDIARNIRETGEFTLHICGNALVDKVEINAIKLGPGINEMEEVGFETVPGETVCIPRVLAAPASRECRRHSTSQLGPAREIILGEIVDILVRGVAINAFNLHIDQQLMHAVGRVGGHTYTSAPATGLSKLQARRPCSD